MPRLECRIAKFCLLKRLLSISAVQATAWASAVTPAWPVQRCSSVAFAGCCASAAVAANVATTTASTNGFRLGRICGFYRCDGHRATTSMSRIVVADHGAQAFREKANAEWLARDAVLFLCEWAQSEPPLHRMSKHLVA